MSGRWGRIIAHQGGSDLIYQGKRVNLEGDFILPAIVTSPALLEHVTDGQVRALFLYEESAEQLYQNFLLREPAQGRQKKRAHVSRLYGQWLKEEAEHAGIPALAARPWDTLFERMLVAMQ